LSPFCLDNFDKNMSTENQTKQFTIEVPMPIVEVIDTLAKDGKRSRNKQINIILEDYVETVKESLKEAAETVAG